MKLDSSHPLNQGVLLYLNRGTKRDAPPIAAPDSVRDAYMGQGSHPDIVERVWDQLGKSLPDDCRCLVHGTPALVHPSAGIVLAICNGTQYNLRLTAAGLHEALAQGVKTTTRWSSGQEMNATEVLGADWVFGAWAKDEPRWCRATYDALSDLAGKLGDRSGGVGPRLDALLRLRRDPGCVRIGMAGGSGSGKSMVCGLIRERLLPCATEVVALDQFFKPVDQLPRYRSSRHEKPQPDYNTPESLMVESMVAQCREIAVAGVVIFDGHFALYYPEMRELMDIKCFVTAELEEMLERRTARNLARGYGGDRENILAYNRECVVPRYEQFIQPTQAFADLVIPNGRADAQERDALIGILCGKIRSGAS